MDSDFLDNVISELNGVMKRLQLLRREVEHGEED